MAALTCSKCKHANGRYNICQKLGFLGVGDDGAFADYVVVEAALPDSGRCEPA
ncbi:MAG: alcohol dehydrogenase catalytic domain-containing protein [Lachnospiraceae bacterium]